MEKLFNNLKNKNKKIKKLYLTSFTIILIFLLIPLKNSYSKDKEQETFVGMENTVGYLTDNRGNKYLIVEEGDGARLIKVRENPRKLLKGSIGISKEDLDIKTTR